VLRPGATATEPEADRVLPRAPRALRKCPTSVDFLDALPRTATGKLQKFVLREKYWKGGRKVN
jgi:fatty-acyl-CoA synthase